MSGSAFFFFWRSLLRTSPAEASNDAIDAWVTTPTGVFIAYLERTKASPFRKFAVSDELNAPGAGSLEYFEVNATVADNPTIFDFGNLVWMRFRGRVLTWVIEQRTQHLDEESGWAQVGGRGVLQLLGDRIVWPTGFDGTNQPKDWLLPVPAGTYSGQVLPNGVSAYWRLNDTAGPMLDSGLDGHDAAVVGGPVRGVAGLLAGSLNKAVYFDGTNYADAGDIFDMDGVPPLDPSSGWYRFTVECWVRPASSPATGERAIVSKSSTPTNGWELSHSKDAVSFRRGSDIVTGPALPMGKITHLFITYDGRDLVMYRNAVAQEPVTSDVNLSGTAQPLRIGMRSNEVANGFVGTIDEVAIYEAGGTGDLQASDAQDHYTVGRGKAIHSQFRTFVQKPAAIVVQKLVEESNARFPAVGIGTVETDPARGDLINQQYRFDNVLDIVTSMTTDMGLGDVQMSGLTLSFFRQLGSDLSDTVIFEEGADILVASREQTERDRGSWVVAEGVGEGGAARVKIASRSDTRRREYYVDAKDARNGHHLQRQADSGLVVLGTEHAVGIDVTDARHAAITDYSVGDWVQVIAPSKGLDNSLRVVAMYLVEDEDKVRVSVDVDTQRTERVLRIAARQARADRQFKTRQRQPQGQSGFRAIDGSGNMDSTSPLEVMWYVHERVTQVDECVVAVHLRRYHYDGAAGVTWEAMPATHSVDVQLWQDGVHVAAADTTIDGQDLDVDIDLSDWVNGPGKYKLVLQSEVGQPQGGRLAADISGHVLGTIDSD